MPWLIVVSLLLIALNAYATARVGCSERYSRQQALLQSVLIWIVPLVGAITVLAVMAADGIEPVPLRGMDDAPRDAMPGIGLCDAGPDRVEYDPMLGPVEPP